MLCLSKFDSIKKKFKVTCLNYKPLKLRLRVFLAAHTVAMVTYCVTTMITKCTPMIGQVFETLVEASSDKEWL